MKIEVYSGSHRAIWDEFVLKSKNGTFLFFRDYMDYHRDRFEDHSLLIWSEKGNLSAVLPANREGTVVLSHGGLTYGGFITDVSMKTPKMLEIFDVTLTYLMERGFDKVVYKTIPHIYHRCPAEEDRYALFLCNAALVRREVLTVVDRRSPLPFQERRSRGARKAVQKGLVVKRSEDFESYWRILTNRLLNTHHVRPAHSLAEIERLCRQFPGNIKLFACFQNSTMLGGAVIYETDQVAHVQYIAASELGLELGALDLLFRELLFNWYRCKSFFDFGNSNEDNGRYLNKGLVDQKEGFGGRAIVHDHYEIQLASWKPGQFVEAMG